MSILDKVKIGNSVQVNLELSKDRLTKETIDAIDVSSLGKISDFRITDGKGIGVVLQLSNGKEQWFFEDEIDLLDENGNGIHDKGEAYLPDSDINIHPPARRTARSTRGAPVFEGLPINRPVHVTIDPKSDEQLYLHASDT